MDDIASRIEANRGAALSYVTSTETPAYLGMGATCDATPATIQEQDAAEWCDALQGVSEVVNGVKVGVMIGARGCIASPGRHRALPVRELGRRQANRARAKRRLLG